MEHKTKYLVFENIESKTKTGVWHISSINSGDLLGVVKWYGGWRQYVFYPESDTFFNEQCLIDIKSFVTEKNKTHRYRL